MKRIHFFSVILGVFLGLAIAGLIPSPQPARAADSNDSLSAEEIDKKLAEILESQKKLKEKITAITTQTQFIKASAGK